ncbi:ABC transporter permease [Shewanella nanhaiensis]|uniref:ABC transporter permease n=1 Tax=Shewanella nanhaiensis TaxID=2864872 RepID=A0ABS7E5A6_9GAMM|nr:FtsX-like permease family protein [Shewanella nanhaiensis]MBW8184321.1 ABC transporter permease [Shewanella nanhaiensis]
MGNNSQVARKKAMTAQIVKLAWRNLWRNKIRTGIMLASMVFGLMGVVTMMGFLSGMYVSMIDNAIAWQTSHVQVQNKRYLEDPDINEVIVNPAALYSELDRLPQVSAYSARVVADGMVASARANRGIRINGVNVTDEAAVTPIAAHIEQGTWLPETGRYPVVVSQKTAERLRLSLGSKVVLTFSDVNKDVTGAAFRVRGIYRSPSSSFDDANLYVRQQELSKLAGVEGVHEIAVLLDASQSGDSFDNQGAELVAQALMKVSSTQNQIRDWQQVQPMLATIISQMGVSNGVILLIFVTAMGFGIINIMLMSVFERTREFGVLMAVGMVKSKVFLLILLESCLLGVTGAALGLLGSFAVIALLGQTGIPLGSMSEGLGAFGVDTTLYPVLKTGEYFGVFLIVVVASMLASLYPARQILKLRPVDAMSHKH